MSQHITMYGTTWCIDCRRAKRFLGEQQVRYRWVNVEDDPDGLRIVERHNDGKQIVPTIVFEDGSVLVEPSNAELAQKLGLPTRAKRTFYDLIVSGAGPAGLTAALYAAREGIETLVLERSNVGGQAGLTERIDNYPGFPEGLTGADFAKRLAEQASRFDVETVSAAEVERVWVDGHERHVATSGGDEYRCHALLIATGSSYRRLSVPGEDDLLGAGIHYCATCDGPFYKGRPVAVVGGGNSALEESLFLTQFVSQLTLLVRGPSFSASKILHDKALASPKIRVRFDTQVRAFRGEKHLEAVVLKGPNGEESLQVPGVFVFIGLRANTAFLVGTLDLDEMGFVSSPDCRTSVEGVFVAGDCRAGSTKQIASATGEGAAAALAIRQYLQAEDFARHAAVEGMPA